MLRLSDRPGPAQIERIPARLRSAAEISAEFTGTPDAPSPRLLTAPTGSASSCSMGRLISDQSLAVVQGVALTAQDSQLGRLGGRGAAVRAENPIRGCEQQSCGVSVCRAKTRARA
jgi:hypothetical protein